MTSMLLHSRQHAPVGQSQNRTVIDRRASRSACWGVVSHLSIGQSLGRRNTVSCSAGRMTNGVAMSRRREAKRSSPAKHKNPKAARLTVPGYEVAANKAGLLPWKWAADRLNKSRQYWIATTRPDGAPHLM